jgi:hypothetical protein
MENIFSKDASDKLIQRINELSAASQPLWGKMSVDQMLAHCNVTYEMTFENKHPKATGLKKFLLKLFVKNMVVSEKPYAKNSRTAPEFLIADNKNYDLEKQRLIDFINKTQSLGNTYFEGRESNSFGHLSAVEWNNMFYKHLDHHLSQFGA